MKRSILLLSLFSQSILASFNINENMQESYAHIIALEFEAAKRNIAIEKKMNPRNGFIHIHENYIDFLTIIIGEDITFFDRSEKKKNIRINSLKENDKDSPYYLYSQADLHLQWAFARLKFQQYIPAIYELIKAYHLLEDNSDLYPSFTLNKKGLGLLHVLFSIVPDGYDWILNVADIQGDANLGFSELNILLDDPQFEMYTDEVLFLVSFLQTSLINNDILCKKYLDRIGDGYTRSHLLTFAAARLSHNLGMNEYCLKVLEGQPSSAGKHPFYFLDYLQAMSYLYKLDYKKSHQYFVRYIDHFTGVNHIKSSYHKLVWISELQQDFDMKKSYFDKVISQGYAYIDVDKVALKHSRNKYIPHPVLLKARLLYDGGYYEKALLELDKIDNPDLFSNKENTIEYWYRMGRVFQKIKGKKEKMFFCFERVISIGVNSDSYYVPMSTLQIAIEYEEIDKILEADSYYRRCLAMKGFDYQRGIHQKAKIALDRIQ